MRKFALVLCIGLSGCDPDPPVAAPMLVGAAAPSPTDANVTGGTDAFDAEADGVVDVAVASLVDAASDAPFQGCDDRSCDDGDPCTVDTCVPGPGCGHAPGTCSNGVCDCGESTVSCPADCTGLCGNGACDGDESVGACPGDCATLALHIGGPCSLPSDPTACPHGYTCVARSAAGGGNVCVAGFVTAALPPDARTPTDFVEHDVFVHDTLGGVDWAKATLPPMTRDAALTACTTQTWGGFVDWRLPTTAEQWLLADFTRELPATAAMDLSWPNGAWHYWNADYVGWGNGRFVAFDYGSTDYTSVSKLLPVRCIRGGAVGTLPLKPLARYTLQDGGKVVLDRLTGLHWQQAFNAAFSWNDAKTYCTTTYAATAGPGWHLPFIRQLQSLLDLSTSYGMDGILESGGGTYEWSATPWVSGNYGWDVNFSSGGCFNVFANYAMLSRCVR